MSKRALISRKSYGRNKLDIAEYIRDCLFQESANCKRVKIAGLFSVINYASDRAFLACVAHCMTTWRRGPHDDADTDCPRTATASTTWPMKSLGYVQQCTAAFQTISLWFI